MWRTHTHATSYIYQKQVILQHQCSILACTAALYESAAALWLLLLNSNHTHRVHKHTHTTHNTECDAISFVCSWRCELRMVGRIRGGWDWWVNLLRVLLESWRKNQTGEMLSSTRQLSGDAAATAATAATALQLLPFGVCNISKTDIVHLLLCVFHPSAMPCGYVYRVEMSDACHFSDASACMVHVLPAHKRERIVYVTGISGPCGVRNVWVAYKELCARHAALP